MEITCKICNSTFETYKLLAIHLRFKHKITAIDYYKTHINTDTNLGICKLCRQPTPFLGINVGFQEYCSKACANKSEIKNEKRKQTYLEKYGVENYAQTQECKDKIKQTCVEKYGTKYVFQSDEVKDKIKQTNLEKYGVENYTQTKECIDKMKKTSIEKYGVDSYTKTNNYKEKTKKTNLTKYACEWCGQASSIKDKIKQSCLNHYGTEYAFQSDDVKDKIKESNSKKYGVENYVQTDEFKEKAKRTNLEKYGVENYAQTQECKDKIKQTCIEKYGTEYITQVDTIKEKMRKSMFDHYGQYSISYSYYYDNKLFDSSWELAYYIWLKDNNIEFIYHPNNIFLYEVNDKTYKYCPDFKINSEFYEIKGLHFFKNHDSNNQMINPYDRSMDDIFEAKHQCMLKNNVIIITDCSKYITYVNEKYGKDYLQKFSKLNIDMIYNNLSKAFPYYNYTDELLYKDFEKLKSTDNTYAGINIVNHYYKNIFACNLNKYLSPIDAWNDEKIIKKVIANRLQYIGRCLPKDIVRGLNVAKIAPKVSVFKPQLAKRLIKTYLNDFNIIFDPFSGFGGRMLGCISLNKQYIGQDINYETVLYSNEIIKKFNLTASVQQKDIFESFGKYDCLFTCSPYQNKEHWNKTDVNKTCDEWIDICMQNFNCKKYLFVVDDTEKYKDKIVETIVNKSHFNTNNEYVLLIEKT